MTPERKRTLPYLLARELMLVPGPRVVVMHPTTLRRVREAQFGEDYYDRLGISNPSDTWNDENLESVNHDWYLADSHLPLNTFIVRSSKGTRRYQF